MQNIRQNNVKIYYFFSCFFIIMLFFLPQCGKRRKLTKKEAILKKESKEQRPFRYKKIERLTFDEAVAVYTYYKKQNKKPQMGQVIERIITLTTDHDFIYPLLIELADLMFEFEDYKKAEEYYGQHAAMYPGGAHRDYVKMRQIESAYKQILDVHRDQTKTKETRKLIESYLPTLKPENPNREKIQKILDQCLMILLESEISYINFYIHKYHTLQQPKALNAAFKRLEHINTTIIPFIKTEQYQHAHKEIAAFFADEQQKRDILNIEKLIKLIHIKKNPTPMLSRF
jgi:outer membrane protein assembly factor BamD (BamD/ComL family)